MALARTARRTFVVSGRTFDVIFRMDALMRHKAKYLIKKNGNIQVDIEDGYVRLSNDTQSILVRNINKRGRLRVIALNTSDRVKIVEEKKISP